MLSKFEWKSLENANHSEMGNEKKTHSTRTHVTLYSVANWNINMYVCVCVFVIKFCKVRRESWQREEKKRKKNIHNQNKTTSYKQKVIKQSKQKVMISVQSKHNETIR